MIRGTTPRLDFVIPFDADLLEKVFVTIAQNGIVITEKNIDDCTCTGNVISVKLTQEDTLKLACKQLTEIQIRAKTRDGEAIASSIINEPTDCILKEGVI